MINYDKHWETISKRGITKYSLIYHYGLSSNLLRRMPHGEPITTSNLNELCLILNCRVEDIIQCNATDEEITAVNQRKEEISNFRKKRPKK